MKKLGILLALLSLVALLAIGTAAATLNYAASFQNPVANGADPFVLKDGDTYYLYATEDSSWGYRVYTSQNLVDWVCHGYCLQKGDVYVEDSSAYYGYWAPEVFKYNGVYYMIYTSQEHLGIATSDSPYGPFTNDTNGGWLFPDFKAIDGHFFQDTDGKIYLYFVSTGAVSMNGYSVSRGNNIWGAEFDMDTLTPKTQPKLLVPGANGESYVAEGPEMLKYNGVYHLTFSIYGYTNTRYSVNDATSDSPLGNFTRANSTNPVMQTADIYRLNPANNLYGTGHHCFTTSPDGTEIIMVYHAHRSGIARVNPPEDADAGTLYVESRRVCLDKVTFDGNVMHAGTNDHPTVGTQSWIPSGATLGRSVELDENFEALLTLPTVYVCYRSGSDSNDGLTRNTPFLTLDAAYAALPNGGTIVLTENYVLADIYNSDNQQYITPAVGGPIMIRGDYSCVTLNFKFFNISSDTYFDNLTFAPRTTGTNSIIQCGFNNVVFGENVGCSARPNAEQFPILVGGRWWYTGTNSSVVYDPYRSLSDSLCTSDKAYTIKVLGGTWSIATKNSVKSTSVMNSTAPNATLVLGPKAIVRPAQTAAPAVSYGNKTATLTLSAPTNTVNASYVYAVYKTVGGKDVLLGYTAPGSNTYVDSTYAFGSSAAYKATAYVNGACFGDLSNATTLTTLGDYNEDGSITILDAIELLRGILDGSANSSLLQVLQILKAISD